MHRDLSTAKDHLISPTFWQILVSVFLRVGLYACTSILIYRPTLYNVTNIRVLRYANVLAYFDSKTFATWEAMMIGRLHCFNPSWQRASVDFLKSGGFVTSPLVSRVQQPTLVLWGANDKILEPETVEKFQNALPQNQVYIVNECGHVPHLVIIVLLFNNEMLRKRNFNPAKQEKAKETASSILKFLGDSSSNLR